MWCILQCEDGESGLYQTWYRCAQSYEHYSSDRVFETNSAAEVWCQVTDDCRQHADDGDRDNEACPTVPVVSGRNKGKQKLPEDGEEVHDIVKTGGQLLFATFIVIIITWAGDGGRARSQHKFIVKVWPGTFPKTVNFTSKLIMEPVFFVTLLPVLICTTLETDLKKNRNLFLS